ncbi:MAG: MFS transporter [Candidatus Rickettsiella isopodorum]|nr:MFS transporter [Candidatus Rickettsiella isopodorum]MDD5162429.1 MFS transporter [Candidatus Rickettsiella isopodorum]MDQ5899473.1 transporter, family, proline/betaine transporter [Pseudomonadota bacterium]
MTSDQKKVVFSACIGTILEWYDFSLYAYLAGIFAQIFFPALPRMGLLLSYSVFAMGYLARPLGAAFFGYLGDTRGRKKALSLSVLLMAIATGGMGLLPGYSMIGISAAFLLLFFRLLQGVAVGGEAFGSACFIVESIPSNKTGFFSSLIWASSVIGLLFGSLIVFILFVGFQSHFLYSFAWRLPFLLATMSGLIAYYIRTRTAETPEFQHLHAQCLIEKFPLKKIFVAYKILIVQLMGLYLLSALITYLIFIFMPVYFTDVLGHSRIHAHALNTLILILLIVLDIFFGWLSDKWGRKPIMLTGATGLMCFSYPLYVMITQGSFFMIVIAQIMFTILAASFQGPLMALTLDRIPVAVRYTLGSFSYNLAYSIFGGTAPLVAIYLITKTTNVAIPGLYLAVGAVVALIMLITFKKGPS